MLERIEHCNRLDDRPRARRPATGSATVTDSATVTGSATIMGSATTTQHMLERIEHDST